MCDSATRGIGTAARRSSKVGPPTRPAMSNRPRRFSLPTRAWAPLTIITASRAGRFRRTGAFPMSSWHKGILLGATLVLGAVPLAVSGQESGYAGSYPFGKPATQADIDAWNKDVRPDGQGLPPGSGTFEKGQKIYAEQCATCHGENLEGIRDPNLPQGGGPALIGGRGTLNTPKFKITVESYWPYASTL